MVAALAHAVCLCLALSAGEPRPLKDVIADLGSREFTVRQSASDELLGDKVYSLAQVEGALKNPDLTAEQRLRLERAGLQLFRDAPHGALGVEFTNALDIAEIGSVKRGFPSAATLKAGDIITQIDGETVTSRITQDRRSSAVRVLVISRDPGDEVPVTVLRNGQTLKLTVTFGDFRDLNKDLLQANPMMVQPVIDDGELAAAWRQRLRRTTGRGEPPALDATSLRPRREAQWSTGEPIDIIDRAARDRAFTGDVPSVTVGAQPDLERQLERADQLANGPWQSRGNGMRAFNAQRAVPIGLANDRDISRQSDAELAVERMRLMQIRMAYAEMAAQPRLTRSERQQFQVFDDALRLQLQQIDAEINRRRPPKPAPQAPPAPPPVVEPLAPDAKPDQKGDKP
ncbi:MAG TPA: PDZ domain-containing protein [Phycisphaerales bacterium]|nr:PDZ domain-containing protein [Phycisphaerales bacterium]